MPICQRWSKPLSSFSAEHCKHRAIQARLMSMRLKSCFPRMLWGVF